MHFKCILGAGLKKEFCFNDNFDSNNIVFSHKYRLLEIPVGFAIFNSFITIHAGLNGQ